MKTVPARLLALAALAAVLALGVRVWVERRLPRVAAREAAAPTMKTIATVAASGSTSEQSVAPTTASKPPSALSAPAPRFMATKKAPMPKVGASGFVVTQAELDDALSSRLGGATTRPIRDEAGRVIGLSVHGVSRLAKFGVVDGDRLVSANGLSLRTPDEALAALGALQHEKRVTFTLARGSSRYTVTVELAQPG